MTEALFQQDPYLKVCTATVTAIQSDRVILDRTVFYPSGGGQPGDQGELQIEDAPAIPVSETCLAGGDEIAHVVDAQAGKLNVGDTVTARINWARRHLHMRMHTCLHLLGAVVPYGVTGGNISAARSRLDFDMQESLDKEAVTAKLNALIESDLPVQSRWISQDELALQPELIRTLSVKPPAHAPRIRLLEIPGVDLQPCGGTHVSHTGEIGRALVSKVEKKGRHNRRVHVVLA